MSIQTVDSRGFLSLTINDDRRSKVHEKSEEKHDFIKLSRKK